MLGCMPKPVAPARASANVRLVPAVAQVQAGVFTARQATAEGWSPATVRYRRRTGAWVVAVGRGLTLSSTPRSPQVSGWATHLTVPCGIVSHATAGAMHGFPVPSSSTGHVIGDLHRRVRDVRVHRDRCPDRDVVRRWGLPVTAPARTAVDVLAMSGFDGALALWAWLATRQILTPESLGLAVRERFGRRGTPVLVRLLGVVHSGAASLAEHRFHQLLRAARITGWQANVPVRDAAGLIGVVDVLFPAARLVIEVDGFAAHSGRDRFVADRRRDSRLTVAGYTVLRVTWDDLRERPAAVIAEIHAVLCRATRR
jgi:very-short-patch-repair endonuclease